MENNDNNLGLSLHAFKGTSIEKSFVNDLEKGKKVPIGTVTNGYKKVGDGKWVKVKSKSDVKLVDDLISSDTGKKMVANLTVASETDKNRSRGRLSEHNWIDELPLKQQELFDTLYKFFNYSRVELAFRLIQNKKLKL